MISKSKGGSIQVSLPALLQIAAAVLISYLLTMVLGMDARVKALEVKQDALHEELQQQKDSISKLWQSKKAK